MSSLFNIGVSGLQTQQSALRIIGQNITNANTPGYTRQRADLAAQVGARESGLVVGAGVRIDNVTRIADAFIDQQVRVDVTSLAQFEAYGDRINQLQNSIYDPDFGIDTAIRDFFDAVQNAANEPTDLAMRQNVISSADALAKRFAGVTERASLQMRDVLSSLESAAVRVNELAELIVGVNQRIASLQSESGAGALNLMLDKREVLIKELASLVSIDAVTQDDGQLNIFVGKGQPLVLGSEASRLGISGDGEITLSTGNSSEVQSVSSSISGGEMGGLLKFREEVLWPAQNEVGRLAAAISSAFNQQHALGLDLEGNLGGDFFRDMNDPALVGTRVDYFGVNAARSGSPDARISVYIDDPFQHQADDYEIRFLESSTGAFTVSRRSDGQIVHHGTSLATPQTVAFEGIRVEFESGEFAPGDAILIRPYAGLGEELAVNVTDPAALALASPVSFSSDDANSGNARLSLQEIIDGDHPVFSSAGSLMPPLLIEFVSDTEYLILDNSNPAQPVALQPDPGLQRITPGGETHILPYDPGTTLVNTSGPAVGDMQLSSGFVNDLTPLGNGYPAGSVTFSGAGGFSQLVDLEAGGSARSTAQALSNVPGVTAAARTQVTLTDLVDHGTGTPLTLAINGVTLQGFSHLGELADAINADQALQDLNISARSDGSTLTLLSRYGDDLALHLQGDPNESVTVTNVKGESHTLRGSVTGSFDSMTVGGEISILLEPDLTITAQYDGVLAANPIQHRADMGFDAVLTGNVDRGDRFSIDFNQGGIADNRNANALAGLIDNRLMGHPPSSFAQTFGNLVQDVGVRAAQIETNREASQALLEQSEAFRESISGVNLDEEAANLIRHEQAYNAAAQVISVARDIFNILLDSVR